MRALARVRAPSIGAKEDYEMKRIVTHSITRGIATAVVAITVAAAPALAAAQRATHVAMKGKSTALKNPEDDVEGRIKTLHQRLKIKPEQEQAWNNVAQVMRDNANTMKSLREDKAEKLESANAVDQVNSYAALIDAHADGVHKFIPAFKSLYDGLSDEQKKAADAAFRERAREAQRRGRP